jgi:Domain of unknown function (DUF4160)
LWLDLDRVDAGEAPQASDLANAAARGGSMDGVPTISRFFGISIAMFFDDHGPPHFHARHAEGSAKVRTTRSR